MSHPKTLRAPALLHHRASGRAYVMARDSAGNRRAVFLGAHGTAATERAYRQFLADFYAGHPARAPRAASDDQAPPAITVETVCTEFLLYAESRYRRSDGTATGEALNFAHSFVHLLRLYRDMPANVFDVSMLEAVQMAMVQAGLARSVVNARTARIRRTFRWAVRRKLVPASVWHELQALPGLRPGEHAVREAKAILPVPEDEIGEVLPHLAPQLAAMVRLQVSTGARPGEITCMRMSMLDRSDAEAWIYRPPHKNSWRGQSRTIPLLKGDQELLAPFLRLDDRPLFSPADAERSRGRQVRHSTGDAYDVPAYRKGIRRGVQAANAARIRAALQQLIAAPEARQKVDRLSIKTLVTAAGALRRDVAKVVARLVEPGALLDRVCKALELVPLLQPWAPNRVRHLAATRAVPLVGEDGAQLLLGHSDGRTLKHYVQQDPKRVVDVRKRLG